MRKERPIDIALHRYFAELEQLPNNESQDAAKDGIVALALFLEQAADRPPPFGRSAAEALMSAVTFMIASLDRMAAKGNPHLRSIASARANWPMLVPPKASGVRLLLKRCRNLGVGNKAFLNPRGKAGAKTPEVQWARSFVIRAITCVEFGATFASKLFPLPIATLRPLEKLPRFDGSEKCFRIWDEAMWDDVLRRYSSDQIRRHSDFQHLPGCRKDSRGSAVPESRIRDRLRRALRQTLNIRRPSQDPN
ncbi:MAG: hypothetical protein HZC55_20105 [Verrucomicrobia bacterium]|nr:hypothetical protein [Verrucomicrobiota bacterium]